MSSIFLSTLTVLVMMYFSFDVVFFSDLDVHLTPRSVDPAAWRLQLQRFYASPLHFVGSPDHSAPVNTGLWLAKPSIHLVNEAIALFRYGSWSKNTGFNNAGKTPSSLLEASLVIAQQVCCTMNYLPR